MDIVLLLEDAIGNLPSGDYSVGLNAIARHIKAAIRHLERDKTHDPDSCTDAIYRMNQAYEGSLKESYRVLAGKDPAGLSTYQIEQYLENNKVIRPRVLVQLTRYRQDYRNPSTHDYKLDFDSDEALLAIVSVCAFATLLTKQIASKLASNVAQSKATSTRIKPRASLRSLSAKISEICLSYTRESSAVGWFEYDKGIAQSLQAAGFNAVQADEDPDWSWGEITVKKGSSRFAIDTRAARDDKTDKELIEEFDVLLSELGEQKVVGGLLILRATGETNFSLFKGEWDKKPIYLIMGPDEEQLNVLRAEVGALVLID